MNGYNLDILVAATDLQIFSSGKSPRGLVVSSFQALYEDVTKTERLAKLLLEQINKQQDPISLMQYANLRKGIFLQAKKVIRQPIILNYKNKQQQAAPLDVEHAIYLIEPRAKIELYEKVYARSGHSSRLIHLRSESKMNYATLLNIAAASKQWNRHYVTQAEKSVFTSTQTLHVRGKCSDLLAIELKGEGAKAILRGASQTEKEGTLEQRILIDHKVNACESEQY